MMTRFLFSCRWALPLVLLLILLAIPRLQTDADHCPAAATVERQDRVAVPSRAVNVAPLDAFDAWLAGGRESEAMARGAELAQERRAAMKELIRFNPQAALERAVPYSVRQQLPAEIVKLLEMPISTTADLDVEQACGGPGGHSSRHQWLTLGGQRVQVFTYGTRAEVMTKQKLSVHGIAIDQVMAMRDDPSPELSTEEAADCGFAGRVAQL